MNFNKLPKIEIGTQQRMFVITIIILNDNNFFLLLLKLSGLTNFVFKIPWNMAIYKIRINRQQNIMNKL